MKISELSGQALDWAVLIAKRSEPYINIRNLKVMVRHAVPCPDKKPGYMVAHFEEKEYSPSTNPVLWATILEEEGISLDARSKTNWIATPPHDVKTSNGPTPGIAVCRCFVASVLGDEIDVPKELL